MKKLSTFILLLICANTLLAQSNFIAGGIINSSGDTIRGQIDYREWIENPHKINFRTTATAEAKSYTPHTIAGFFIDNNHEIYQTAVADLNMEPASVRDMAVYNSLNEANQAFKPVQDTIFMLVIARGGINFFEYTDSKRSHYLIQKGAEPVTELRARTVQIEQRGDPLTSRYQTSGPILVPLNEYRQQLRAVTSDCAGLDVNFDKLVYDKGHLLAVVKKYNQCVHNAGYLKPVTKGEKSLTAIVGATLPIYSWAGEYTQNKTVTAPGSVVPLLGLEFYSGFERARGRIGIGLGAYGSHYTINYARTLPGIGVQNEETYNVNMTILRFYGYYQYKLPLKKVQPYVKIGAGASHYFKTNYYYTKNFGVYDPPLKYERETKKNDLCLLGSWGAKTKRFSVEVRYEWGSNVDFNDASDLAKANQFSLVLGYSFFKKV